MVAPGYCRGNLLPSTAIVFCDRQLQKGILFRRPFIFLGLCGLSIVSVGCPLGRGWTCFEVMTIINLQKTIIFLA